MAAQIVLAECSCSSPCDPDTETECEACSRLDFGSRCFSAPIGTDPVGRPGHAQGDQQWPEGARDA